MNRLHLLIVGLGITAAASAQAGASITGANGVNYTTFSGSITLSPSDNPHSINGDVYIQPGATLTILPGVRFESAAGQNGTLAVCRGAQIYAEGTADAPIVFTSDADTGVYRQNANNEWGNLTVMGAGYISEDEIATNTATPSATNYADMEGLTPTLVGLNDYGGGNDNDDSGTIAYCTFQYGGIASIPGKELNGLSLGGIGRGTDIHHVEVLNNIDDGIEVWGGTVNLSYISIWNIGDDSLDIDQGWRGKAQFGLIVQGASNTGAQGSGFGDNAMEIDGAERCDWQPVTTAAIHNFTVIGGGQSGPSSSGPTDNLVEFRDNARVQFLNCIFMEGGKEVFNDKVTDGEVNNNTTVCGPGSAVPQMAARMTADATSFYSNNAFSIPAVGYQAQDLRAGHKQVELRGSVYYNNLSTTAYADAVGFGIFPQSFPVAGTNHGNNSIELSSPITALTRSATEFVASGHSYFPVTFLDPTPTAAASTVAEVSLNDGFFRSAPYAGGFAPGNNWLIGWSRTSTYGLTTQRGAGVSEPIHGTEIGGAFGHPVLSTAGTWAPGTAVTQELGPLPLGLGFVMFSTAPANPVNPAAGVPVGLFGVSTLIPSPTGLLTLVTGAPGGNGAFSLAIPPGVSLSGQTFYSQGFALDGSTASGLFSVSNAQRHNL
ncbi:MAG: hypothetical protein ACON4Z_10635 [Planctomycetota bacterium]